MDPQIRDVTPVAGLDPQLGLLLGMLDDGTREWRRELGEVTDEAVIWQPFPGGHSIDAILLHIANVEAGWLHEVAGSETRTDEERVRLLSKETHKYQVQWPRPPEQPLAWYFEQHDAIRARTHVILRGSESVERVGHRNERAFTLRWLLHHVITHEAYHGGQAVLLALMQARAGR
jgi:uncharacterized damage-inducible protein DinB